ncbi:MAG: hypothetical protein D6765_14560 [Bacteroidetes bacterium]|nr:MAG: hypothetical protein D6765_14560 [Bacteroidota bacterium]
MTCTTTPTPTRTTTPRPTRTTPTRRIATATTMTTNTTTTTITTITTRRGFVVSIAPISGSATSIRFTWICSTTILSWPTILSGRRVFPS